VTDLPQTADGERAMELRPSKGRTILLLIISVGFAAAGLVMRRSGDPAAVAAGTAGAVFFGLGIPVALRNLLDRRPYLTINDEGIFYRFFPKCVPWDDIVSVRLLRQGSREFVCLHLNHVESYMSPRSQRLLTMLGSRTRSCRWRSPVWMSARPT
jgi:hypothetical protein